MSTVYEPRNYDEAKLDPDWQLSMLREIEALEKNKTWELTDLPQGKTVVGSTWKYKLKFNPDGTVSNYKSRVVAQGFTQVEGLDYQGSFSPVAKWDTIRLLLNLATVNHWFLHQVDINNAFLHGYLKEEIYMAPPPGYSKARPGQVCKLIRSIYGLKQASREWNAELTNSLLSYGFTQSPHDHCLFTKHSGRQFLVLLVYVDDVLISGTCNQAIKDVKQYLHGKFTQRLRIC